MIKVRSVDKIFTGDHILKDCLNTDGRYKVLNMFKNLSAIDFARAITQNGGDLSYNLV
jgi:hypothetical protein